MRTGQELSSVVGESQWVGNDILGTVQASRDTVKKKVVLSCPQGHVQILRRPQGLVLLGRKVLLSFYMNKGIPRSGLCEHLFQSSKTSLRLAQTQPDSPLFHFPAKITLPLGNGSQLWGGEGLCLKEREVYILCFGIKNTSFFFFFSVSPEKP